MNKKLFFIILLFLSLCSTSQSPEDLMVYSVRGTVTVSNNVSGIKDQPVKIGAVLHPADILKSEKNASLTMICNRGKALLLNKEGVFSVRKWKDSCSDPKGSVSSTYFRYIWGQMYSYSPENKEAARKKSDMAVVRGNDFPLTSGTSKPGKLTFSKGMDTVNYAGQLDNFPLSWTVPNYKGKFAFKLYNAKGTKLLYQDTLRANFIPISSFRDKMEPGKSYRWTVTMKNGGPSRKRVLNYISSPAVIDTYLAGVQLPAGIEEDSALAAFRAGYMLEKKHYLEAALLWYERAEAASPDNPLFRDQLIRFRNEFWVR